MIRGRPLRSILIALVALVACGQEEPSQRRLRVEAFEYGFRGIPERLAPGPIELEVTNVGGEGHDFILMRVLDPDASVPEAAELPQPEREEVLRQAAARIVVNPGDSAAVDAVLQPGPFAYVCLTTTEAGRTHAYEGMWGTFEVR